MDDEMQKAYEHGYNAGLAAAPIDRVSYRRGYRAGYLAGRRGSRTQQGPRKDTIAATPGTVNDLLGHQAA